MSIGVDVYAPSVEGAKFFELTKVLALEAKTGVKLRGRFGGRGPRPATFMDLRSLTSGIDLNQYWALVGVYLNTPCGAAVMGVLASKIFDCLLEWARHQERPENKKIKVRLYGPDNRLLEEEDV